MEREIEKKKLLEKEKCHVGWSVIKGKCLFGWSHRRKCEDSSRILDSEFSTSRR